MYLSRGLEELGDGWAWRRERRGEELGCVQAALLRGAEHGREDVGVCAPGAVRFPPPHILRLTTAGRIACSASVRGVEGGVKQEAAQSAA
jgi:hypothetical protein